MLCEQSLVRSIDLPLVLETMPEEVGDDVGPYSVPDRTQGANYPCVAVIDGGVSDALKEWKIGEAGLVPGVDRDEKHGTFIAGLICAGASLNPSLQGGIEARGCTFYDLDLFPREEMRSHYYRDVEELFDVLDEKVKVARRDHAVRVFNLSFSLGRRASRFAYSKAADRLDRIARANDVIFVVAAGNLRPAESRPRWPEKAEDAVIMLASFSHDHQYLTAPSEHILGITVGAVNPPGVHGHPARLPTTYTRRGPGVGGARKPELAHYGGIDTKARTGLVSLTPDGQAVHNCGTSFAAPLTAATIATLDHRLEHQASREVLMALPIHRARRAKTLDSPALRHVSREFVGFGIPSVADSLLDDDPYSVTLIFNERLRVKQRLEFPFVWPRSLVREDGACRGRADITLCFAPPVDPDHGEEAVRVQLEAHLHQENLNPETGELTWESRLNHDNGDVLQGSNKTEIYLVKTGLKWSPCKRYHAAMPKGRGNTSNWKVSLESLVRAGFAFPIDGLAFCLVLTITDLDRGFPIREEVRLDLTSRGLILADITIAHRLRPRP
jgi:hypothetical protein